MPRLSILLLVCLLIGSGSAYAGAQAESMVYQAPAQAKAAAMLHASTTAKTTTVALPAPSSSELAPLNDKQSKAFIIGVGRALPASLSNSIDLTQWQWENKNNGAISQLILSSEGASRVRVLASIEQFPAGVSLLFFSPSTQEVYGSYTTDGLAANQTPQDEHGAYQLWSPTVAGTSIGIEIFVPNNVDKNTVKFSLPLFSHLLVDPSAASTLNSAGLASVKSSLRATDPLACQVDIGCAPAYWQQMAKSVARYAYTNTNGLTYLCSGTLINREFPLGTPKAYFITAAHCISNSTSASNMEFYWLYRNSGCSTNDATYTKTTGGSTLLNASTDLDSTLVELKTNPPSGVVLTGWKADPLNSKDNVTALHHPQGIPEKISSGQFNTRISVYFSSSGYSTTPDSAGLFSQVLWTSGVTAPGSSGSGLWTGDSTAQYLRGTLLGGTSSCENMGLPDDYSRFELFYPRISQWLSNVIPTRLNVLSVSGGDVATALRDGVVIGRYLQGLRGTALTQGITTSINLTDLDTKLNALNAKLDIDGDGVKETKQDGLLVVRYLMGLRGNGLMGGLDLSKSNRNSESALLTYLDALR